MIQGSVMQEVAQYLIETFQIPRLKAKRQKKKKSKNKTKQQKAKKNLSASLFLLYGISGNIFCCKRATKGKNEFRFLKSFLGISLIIAILNRCLIGGFIFTFIWDVSVCYYADTRINGENKQTKKLDNGISFK